VYKQQILHGWEGISVHMVRIKSRQEAFSTRWESNSCHNKTWQYRQIVTSWL